MGVVAGKIMSVSGALRSRCNAERNWAENHDIAPSQSLEWVKLLEGMTARPGDIGQCSYDVPELLQGNITGAVVTETQDMAIPL